MVEMIKAESGACGRYLKAVVAGVAHLSTYSYLFFRGIAVLFYQGGRAKI